MVRRLGRQRQLPDVAGTVAVRHADGGGRTDRHDDHEGAVADRNGDLVGAHGLLAEPAHHDASADERRGFEEHLHRDRKPHVQQVLHRGPRIVAGREPVEVAAVFVAVVEVADHQDRGDDAREQRTQPGTLGTHFGEPEAAVDEHRVEADVGHVGDDRHDHLDLGVAHAFEKLLECEEEHDERHAEYQHLVVGDGHVDDLDRLAEVVHERDDRILYGGHREPEQRVEQDAVLQQPGRLLAVALRVEFAHEGRHAQRDADGGDEKDEEHRPAERYGGQRHRIVAAVAADHQVVGHLREDLSQLRQYDGQGQPQVGFVLVFVFRETVHRFSGLGCKDSHLCPDCNPRAVPG